MRFEYCSLKIAEEAATKLLLGANITDLERLHLIKALANAAKKNKELRLWHYMLNFIDSYENIVDMGQIDKILIKWIAKLDFMEDSE